MEEKIRDEFIRKWRSYFTGADLPIAFYYTDAVSESELADSRDESRCLIGNIQRVREGRTFVYSLSNPGCPGGKRYAGFVSSTFPPVPTFRQTCSRSPFRCGVLKA